MAQVDLDAIWAAIGGSRFELAGRWWIVASVHGGPKPWAWIVNLARPAEQARLPVAALMREG